MAHKQRIIVKNRYKYKKKKKRRGVRDKTIDNRLEHENILKYYRVVMYWVKRNYDLTQADIDMLFFIYDIPLFTSTEFDEFSKMVSWDIKRFRRLMREGWIVKYRKEGMNKHALYRISPNGKRLVNSCYKKLKGEQLFAEKGQNNKVMKGERSTDVIMARKMKEINQRVRDYAREPKWVRDDV